MPPEGVEGGPTALNSVTLAMSAVTEDGRCVKWTSLSCHTVKGPDRGDLAIVLPDDEASLAEASAYRAQGNSCSLMSRVPAWRSGCAHLSATLSAIFHDIAHVRPQNAFRLLDGWIDHSMEIVRPERGYGVYSRRGSGSIRQVKCRPGMGGQIFPHGHKEFA